MCVCERERERERGREREHVCVSMCLHVCVCVCVCVRVHACKLAHGVSVLFECMSVVIRGKQNKSRENGQL